MVDSMCQGGLLKKSETRVWNFLEQLMERLYNRKPKGLRAYVLELVLKRWGFIQ